MMKTNNDVSAGTTGETKAAIKPTIVIGATNRPEVLDPAVLRPGRFDKILQVGLPGHQKRIEILKLEGKNSVF